MEHLNILINNVVAGTYNNINTYENDNKICLNSIHNDNDKPNIIHILFGGYSDEDFSSIYQALLIKSLDGKYMYIDIFGIKPAHNINLLHIRKGINWDDLIDFNKLNLNNSFKFDIMDYMCNAKPESFDYQTWDCSNLAWLLYGDELEQLDLHLVWDIINNMKF